MKNVTTVANATKEQENLDLKAQVEATQAQLRLLKEQLKEQNKKEKKPLKGTKVRFYNKAGELIEGLGVLYYYVTVNGKSHLKEASKVEIIKES